MPGVNASAEYHNGERGQYGESGGAGGTGGAGGVGVLYTGPHVLTNRGAIYVGGARGSTGPAGGSATFDAGWGGTGGGVFGGGTAGGEPSPDPWPDTQQGGNPGVTPAGDGHAGIQSGGGGGGGGSIPFIGGGSGGWGGDGIAGAQGAGGDGGNGAFGQYRCGANHEIDSSSSVFIGGSGGNGGQGGFGGSGGGGGGGAGEYWGIPPGIGGGPGSRGAGGSGGGGGPGGAGSLLVEGDGRCENHGRIHAGQSYEGYGDIGVSSGGVLVNHPGAYIHNAGLESRLWVGLGGLLVNNGSIYAPVRNSGVVRGRGEMYRLENHGRFEPGDSVGPATLSVYAESGTLQIQIGGTGSYDQVLMGYMYGPEVSPGAVLELAFVAGFDETGLHDGDSFDVLKYAPYGSCSPFTLDTHLAPVAQGTWQVSYNVPSGYERCVRVTYRAATSVAREGVPRDYALLAAAPNPANATCRLAFELPRESIVSLRVHGVDGRLVRTLVAGESMPAGRHQVPWDGRDDAGRTLAAGVYFYRMSAGDFEASRRILLVR